MNPNLLFAVLTAYFIGSIPFSQIVGALRGVDLRKAGTRNVGGTNLISTAGAGWGVLGGGLDVFKGAAAIWLTQNVFGITTPAGLIAGIAAVAGHCWSPWIGFKGGKGLATTGGILLWVVWPFGLVPAAIYAILHWVTRNGTTAAIGAFVSTFIYFILTGVSASVIWMVAGIVCIVLLASLNDLLHTARAADSWKDNFVTSKEQYGKAVRDRKIKPRKKARSKQR